MQALVTTCDGPSCKRQVTAGAMPLQLVVAGDQKFDCCCYACASALALALGEAAAAAAAATAANTPH